MGRRKPPTAPSLVYVVRDRAGFLKIGTTADLPTRLRTLARLCNGKVELLATLPGDKALESDLHARFRADAIHGEYFTPSPAILAWVEGLKQARREAVSSSAASASPFARNLPPWVAVELRPGLPTCGCVQLIQGIAYAQGACGACHGAGVTFVARAA